MNSKRHIQLLNFSFRFLWIVVALFGVLEVQAQGWENYYGESNDDESASKVLELADHGYIMVGSSNGGGFGGYDMYVLRTDVDGEMLWEAYFGGETNEFGNGIVEVEGGGFVLVGETNGGGAFGMRDVFMVRIDSLGNMLWEKSFGGFNDDRGFDVEQTADGGFVISGGREVLGNEDVYIIKTDANGDLIWETNFGSVEDDEGRAILETADGGFIVAGSTGDIENSDVYVVKINASQNVVWANTYGGPGNDLAYDLIQTSDDNYVIAGKVGNQGNFYLLKLQDNGNTASVIFAKQFGEDTLFEEAKGVAEASDGGLYLAGQGETSAVDVQAILMKTNAEGDLQWTRYFGQGGVDNTNGVATTVHRGAVIVGTRTASISALQGDVLVIKTDVNGAIYNNTIKGNVYLDAIDCEFDGNEEPVRAWTLKAVGDQTFYGTTDENGYYEIPVALGDYEVEVILPNKYWMPCVATYNVNLNDIYTDVVRNFAIYVDTDCTDLEVDVSTPFVESCEESVYTITYCNQGTITAENVEVDLVLTPNLSYVGSSIPFTENLDSLFVFATDDELDAGECKEFTMTVLADCDALLGETHCVKAHIRPDDICLPNDPNWDGSSLEVDAYCDGDSVRFQITNVGAAMQDAVNYIVVEDILMGYQGGVQLDEAESLEFAREATGGTYRLLAEQVIGHPGKSINPTIAIEGCVAGGGNNYSTGFYNQFPEDDKDYFVESDCQENVDIDLFQPQTKRGYPKGYGDNFEVTAETDLKFHIKFQNTGIDTAIRVVIRDTLSPYLDPQTVRPGASSHDYEFEVYGEGILKFTFNNIMLVDGSTNFDASHAFVKYRISQKSDNPVGTAIEGGTAIYFDYDAPPSATDSEQIVGGVEWTDFIIVNDVEVFVPNVDLRIFPNPFVTNTTFELTGWNVTDDLVFRVYDLTGRQVRVERFTETTFTFERDNLPTGMYFYRLESGSLPISVGKIVID